MFLKKAVAAILVLAAVSAFAGDAVTAPAVKESPKGPEVAIFTVPGLTDAALVKSLSASLAKETGVVAAKADAAAGKFMVTFEPGKTTPEALGKALATVSSEAKFEKVQAADTTAAKHDCGKCPSKASCASKK